MGDGNGRAETNSERFERQFREKSETYKANGYHHDDGRDIAFKCMADILVTQPPELPWLVEGYIPLRTVTLLTGDGGVGKSLLAMQLMAAVAAGSLFLGMGCKKGRAVGLFCEDEQAVLHHRQYKMMTALQMQPEDFRQFYFMDRADEDSVMFGPLPEDTWAMDFTDFYYRVRKQLNTLKPQVFVLDTAADIYGAKENDRPQVRAFIKELRRMAMHYNCAVVLCAHPSLSGISSGSGFSGSTAWHNSVRSRLYLTKPEESQDEDERLIKGMKSNYGPIQQDLKIRYEDGVFVRQEDDRGAMAAIERGVLDKAIIELVRSHAIQQRHLSRSPNSGPRYLPLVASRSIPKMKAGTAKGIMNRLMIDGAIDEIVVNKDSKKVGLIATEAV